MDFSKCRGKKDECPLHKPYDIPKAVQAYPQSIKNFDNEQDRLKFEMQLIRLDQTRFQLSRKQDTWSCKTLYSFGTSNTELRLHELKSLLAQTHSQYLEKCFPINHIPNFFFFQSNLLKLVERYNWEVDAYLRFRSSITENDERIEALRQPLLEAALLEQFRRSTAGKKLSLMTLKQTPDDIMIPFKTIQETDSILIPQFIQQFKSSPIDTVFSTLTLDQFTMPPLSDDIEMTPVIVISDYISYLLKENVPLSLINMIEQYNNRVVQSYERKMTVLSYEERIQKERRVLIQEWDSYRNYLFDGHLTHSLFEIQSYLADLKELSDLIMNAPLNMMFVAEFEKTWQQKISASKIVS